MTEREMDRTKSELVRALRRRAAELEAQEHELRRDCGGSGHPGARRVREPNGRRAHQVAFFARPPFRFTAATPAGVPAGVAAGRAVVER